MKQIIAIITCIVVVTTSVGCIDKRHLLRGEGSILTDERPVSSFREIECDGDLEVRIQYASSSQRRVVVTGYQNLLAAFETNVSNGRLSLKFKDKYWNIRNNNLEVTVYTPDLERLDINGSGDVEVRDELQWPKLEVNVSGSGSVRILDGDFQELNLKVNGSGTIHAEDALAKDVFAEVSGSGYIATTVSRYLWARVYGSGTIDHWGHPNNTDTRTEGSGRINRK
jgi:hypothetical protein